MAHVIRGPEGWEVSGASEGWREVVEGICSTYRWSVCAVYDASPQLPIKCTRQWDLMLSTTGAGLPSGEGEGASVLTHMDCHRDVPHSSCTVRQAQEAGSHLYEHRLNTVAATAPQAIHGSLLRETPACLIAGDWRSLGSPAANIEQLPVASMMYGFSVAVCMSSALSAPGGLGLGTLGFNEVGWC